MEEECPLVAQILREWRATYLNMCSTTSPAQAAVPHTEASTSWGFGGFWIKGGTCYYIQGAWTSNELS
jgi:hypothetical protein